jgi:hypothetical protein
MWPLARRVCHVVSADSGGVPPRYSFFLSKVSRFPLVKSLLLKNISARHAAGIALLPAGTMTGKFRERRIISLQGVV